MLEEQKKSHIHLKMALLHELNQHYEICSLNQTYHKDDRCTPSSNSITLYSRSYHQTVNVIIDNFKIFSYVLSYITKKNKYQNNTISTHSSKLIMYTNIEETEDKEKN